jgi:catechol 2,3-dioxygenase-like lactoylglutathione lyase family enzyme
MGLSEHRVGATIAVADMEGAREFYEGKLGLRPGAMNEEGGVLYECGGGTTLLVYLSPEHAGKSTATLATWEVPDLEAAVDELAGAGVEFQRYEQFPTDERGIHSLGPVRVAWLMDPEGNTIAVGEVRQ